MTPELHTWEEHRGDRGYRATPSSCPGTSPRGSPITTCPPLQLPPPSRLLFPWHSEMTLWVNTKLFFFLAKVT